MFGNTPQTTTTHRRTTEHRRLLAWSRELGIPAALSLIVALMVVLGGQMIARAEAQQLLPPEQILRIMTAEVDPRDEVVANGWVTPWMERQNTPDLSLTP